MGTLKLEKNQKAFVELEGRPTALVLTGEDVGGKIEPTVALCDLPGLVQSFVEKGVGVAADNQSENRPVVISDRTVPGRLRVIRCIVGEPLMLNVRQYFPQGMSRFPTREVVKITVI